MNCQKLLYLGFTLLLTACVAQPDETGPIGNTSSQTSSSLPVVVVPPVVDENSQLSGKALYEKDLGQGSCASCHGLSGEGEPGKGGALIGEECHACTVSPAQLVASIDLTMPLRSEHLCVGECASKVAEYVYETFYGGTFSVSCNDGIQKSSPMRRLNKTEIVNAINDVFNRGGAAMAAALEDEQEVIGGFATVGSALSTSTDWVAALANGAMAAADLIVDNNVFPTCNTTSIVPAAGPKLGECSTTAECKKIYKGATDCSNSDGGVCKCGNGFCAGNSSPTTTSPDACFDEALAAVAKPLFRSSLSRADITRFRDIRDNVAKQTGNNKDGDKAAIVALLTSPKFIFSIASDDKTTARSLTGKEMADRLALTLWGSVPDEALIDLGKNNQLSGNNLEKQIDRMMADDRFDRFANFFGDSWLGLGGYLQEGADLNLTNAQWNTLLEDMKSETRRFIRHVFTENLPINTLYTAEYSFLNARLQKHYGFNVTTDDNTFVKTNFPAGSGRRGLMTQAAILAKAFDGTKTSVVKRGVLPLEAFTCTAPEAPSGDAIADAINAQANAATTEKAKVIERANQNACASCHAVIDPMGWVFTAFGVAGESVNLDPDGDALDTSGTLYNQRFADAHSMVDILVEENTFTSCFANKFLIHSIGRKVSYSGSLEDQCAIDSAISQATISGEVRARDLIKALLTNPIATVSGTVEEL